MNFRDLTILPNFTEFDRLFFRYLLGKWLYGKLQEKIIFDQGYSMTQIDSFT